MANDIGALLDKTNIGAIYCNGTTAYNLYNKYIKKKIMHKINANAVLLPSTSPANAAFSLADLINSWGRIKTALKRRDFNAPYYSLSEYAYDLDDMPDKLYRLSLDGGFTCPNRDGTLSDKGCIFCSAGGSGDFAADENLPISKQLLEQKKLIGGKLPKTKSVGYIAYFQANTGTYDAIERLRKLYMQAIDEDDVCILSIATRPDCLSKEVLELLGEMNKIKPVWVELGLQTVSKKSAEYINRQYELGVYKSAVTNLKKIGITQIVTHVILGLPRESKKNMLQTIKCAIDCGSNALKLSMLHILNNTAIADDYRQGKFSLMSLDEYKELLCDIFKTLPPDVVVHRFTGDGNKRDLIAPLWAADKKRVLNTINKAAWDMAKLPS